MLTAYIISMIFCLTVGYIAANNKIAERIVIPMIDICQSAPILSFVPVFIVGLSFLPSGLLVETTAIFLIMTNMAWNLTFAWYQALKTIPYGLQDASKIFGLNRWMRFKTLELPFASLGIIWNSILSWTGGWYFLQLSEAFTAGNRNVELPGLGSYIAEAAIQGDIHAMIWGVVALIAVVIIIDQLVWRPVLVWADKFKVEGISSGGDSKPTSWFYNLISKYHIIHWIDRKIEPITEKFDRVIIHNLPSHNMQGKMLNENQNFIKFKRYTTSIGALLGIVLVYWLIGTIIDSISNLTRILMNIPIDQWEEIGLGLFVTFVRVLTTVIISLLITIPIGIYVGGNKKWRDKLQIFMQIGSSIPATVLFPIVVIVLIGTIGLNPATIILMMTGATWYLLYNIIAGVSAMPQDLKDLSVILRLDRWTRLRMVTLPALFPFLVTGAITAAGGAWSTSIASEYLNYGGNAISAIGIGSIIAGSLACGNNNLMMAATLSLILAVVIINVTFWRKLYSIVEEKYHLD
jgi:NitT/TauT family transport system permease protein